MGTLSGQKCHGKYSNKISIKSFQRQNPSKNMQKKKGNRREEKPSQSIPGGSFASYTPLLFE